MERPDGFAYDQVAYPSAAVRNMAPAALAAAAAFYGVRAPDPATAATLEIGCGDGLTLLACAAAAPGARFSGFDLSARAIERGRDLARRAGLERVTLEAADLMDVPLDGPPSDYVVAHGFYAWVPPEVADRMLALIAARLAPGGIACVSYDCLPVAAAKREVSAVLRRFGGTGGAPAERHARAAALVELLATTQEPGSELGPYVAHLRETIGHLEPEHLVHDHLSALFAPVSVVDFAERAARHGLEAFGDAELDDLHLGLDGRAGDVARRLAPGYAQRAYLKDAMGGVRRFRATLLRRTDAPPPAADPTVAMDAMSFASAAVFETDGEGREIFVERSPVRAASVMVDDPDKRRVLAALAARRPDESTIDALAAGLPDLGRDRIKAALLPALIVGCVRPWATPQPFAGEPGERPRTSALIAAGLESGRSIATLRLDNVRFDQPVARRFVQLLDGTRDRDALAREMSAEAGAAISREAVDAQLAKLAALAVFPAA